MTAELIDRAYANWNADGLSSTTVHHTQAVLDLGAARWM
jgi:hypothetical protein